MKDTYLQINNVTKSYGTDITALDPEKRHLNMVFQNYALFEHMTVKENIGYGDARERAGRGEQCP